MNWGKWIIVSYIFFAAFIATLVTVCVRQDISLVSKDYYKEELVYLEQIQRTNNAERLEVKPMISIVDKKRLKIDFDQFHLLEKGKLKLFCPSNANLDQEFEILPSNESTQFFPLGIVQHTMYRAKCHGQWVGKSFTLNK